MQALWCLFVWIPHDVDDKLCYPSCFVLMSAVSIITSKFEKCVLLCYLHTSLSMSVRLGLQQLLTLVC